MQPLFHLSLAGVLLLSGCSAWRLATPRADWVLRGGVVHTQDPARPRASALALKAGRVLAVGDDAEMSAFAGPDTAVVELAGRAVTPGFHDGHVHPLTSGIELAECYLGDLDTRVGYVKAVQAKLKAYAAANPTKAWIRGGGWSMPWFPGGNPHKAWLDAVAPDRPVVLWASDGHSAWVNSKALAIAGITRDTPNPPHGRIERDARGEATGTLREDATELVWRHMPEATAEEREAGLLLGLAEARKHGLTTLIEANADEAILATYQALERRGLLTARVVASLYVDPAAGAAQVAGLAKLRERYRSPRVRPHAAKLFVDGVVESRTGALVAPYVGGQHPAPAIAPAQLNTLVTALDAAGFQAHMHATGDGAVRAALDAVAAARQANGVRDSRHAIAHLEMIHPQDVPRFAALGVIACFQPYWAQHDNFIRTLTEPGIGPERSRTLYPIGAVWRTGAHVAFGSDWSVASLDPLDGMAVAVSRRDPTEGPGPAWLPDQTITPAQALSGYTTNGAYMAFQEQETGMLRPGMAADLVVLAKDPLALPPHQVPTARVLLTLLAGEAIYTAPGFSWVRPGATP